MRRCLSIAEIPPGENTAGIIFGWRLREASHQEIPHTPAAAARTGTHRHARGAPGVLGSVAELYAEVTEESMRISPIVNILLALVATMLILTAAFEFHC